MAINYPSTQLLIPVQLIFLDADRREIDDDHVRRLAEDIDCIGLNSLPTVLDIRDRKKYKHIIEHYKVPKGFDYFLVTGAHRFTALSTYLEQTEIPCAIHDGEYKISRKMQVEWTENNTRLDEPWQERCLRLLKIHRQVTSEKRILENKRWTALATGGILGLSRAHTSTMLKVAEELEDKNSPCWACETLSSAYNLILKEAEGDAVKELNRRKREQRMASVTPEALAELRAPEKGMTKPAYMEKIGSKPSEDRVIAPPVLHRPDLGLFCEDCQLTMPRLQSNFFDAIITDPMYGIDAKVISKDRNAAFLTKFKAIQKDNDPIDEIALLISCMPEFYRILKENSWFVFFYDFKHHEKLLAATRLAGFKTQEWPMIWIKTHPCSNQAPKFNTTKNFEPVMVCRKGNATLLDQIPRSTFVASRNDCDFVKENSDHPFVKPYLAWDALFAKRIHPGAKLYEPFAGRGSLLNWAYRNGMNVVASENVEDHFAYLVRNVTQWQADATSSQTPTETTTGSPS